MTRTIQRTCTVCSTEISIQVDDDGSYRGAHYFGEVDFPDRESEGKHRDTGERVDGHKVVEWTGDTISHEYWECDDCYRE